MQKKHGSIDGFMVGGRGANGRPLGVPARRLNPQNGQPQYVRPLQTQAAGGYGATALPLPLSGPTGPALSRPGVTRGDLDESLKAIDTDKKKKSNKHNPYVRARRRKLIRRIVLTIVVLVVIGAGALAYKAFNASSKIFKGNIIEALTNQNTPLAKDRYGKTNILIFGTSEDDPGHDGANLTDSIMILSIDQDKKTASMLSVPRDLWVRYDTPSCMVGNSGKINAAYICGLDANKQDQDAASKVFMQKVDEVFGVDLQYYAHVNYTVVKDVVDSVGGVDINIQSPDPRGILDRNFDWTCNYRCYMVKYPNGPAHLDGAHALALARARNDAGGYGLPGGNFDREKNQQMILKAVQTKAMTTGTLANPVKVFGLIDSLGNNIRTNFQTKEISTLINLAKEIKPDSITSLNLDDQSSPLVTTGTGPDGSSIVKPVAGLMDYSGLQAYMKAALSADPSALENASVAVYNGSQTVGAAGAETKRLTAAGFNVISTADAVNDYTKSITLFDQSGGKKPATLAKLEKQLGVTATKGSPSDVTSTADFVVVIGTPPSASSTAPSAQ